MIGSNADRVDLDRGDDPPRRVPQRSAPDFLPTLEQLE